MKVIKCLKEKQSLFHFFLNLFIFKNTKKGVLQYVKDKQPISSLKKQQVLLMFSNHFSCLVRKESSLRYVACSREGSILKCSLVF